MSICSNPLHCHHIIRSEECPLFGFQRGRPSARLEGADLPITRRRWCYFHPKEVGEGRPTWSLSSGQLCSNVPTLMEWHDADHDEQSRVQSGRKPRQAEFD